MWTGLILVCSLQDPNVCIAASSMLAYATEQECEGSFVESIDFVTMSYPGFVIVDGPKCYKWDYNPPNV